LAAAAFALRWLITAPMGVVVALGPEDFDIEGDFIRVRIS
jgi:hypothetical protein